MTTQEGTEMWQKLIYRSREVQEETNGDEIYPARTHPLALDFKGFDKTVSKEA